MDVRYQFVDLDKSEALQDLTQKKLDKLEEKYDDIISAEVHFKRHEPEDPRGYICNIRLSLPGPVVFAESNEESFEAAAVETVNDLNKQLKKRKGKMKAH